MLPCMCRGAWQPRSCHDEYCLISSSGCVGVANQSVHCRYVNNVKGALDKFPELKDLGLVDLNKSVGTSKVPSEIATVIRCAHFTFAPVMCGSGAPCTVLYVAARYLVSPMSKHGMVNFCSSAHLTLAACSAATTEAATTITPSSGRLWATLQAGSLLLSCMPHSGIGYSVCSVST